jgi:hypothetical protein
LKKYQNAEECCKNVKTMMIKLKVTDDAELKAGQEELWGAIRKALGKSKDEGDSDKEMGDDDEEGYETVS